jgi:hypothetical protein
VSFARRLAVLAVLSLTGLPQPGQAERKYLETEHFRIIYNDPFLTHLAPYTARCLESALTNLNRLMGYVPD